MILSQLIAFGVSSLLYKGTVDHAINTAEAAAPEFVAAFSDAVMAEDATENEFTITRDPNAILVATAAQTALLIVISCAVSASVVKRGTGSLRKVEG